MANFSSLAGLEVPQKFVGVWWLVVGWEVTTVSILNEVAFELGFDKLESL